MALTFGHGPLLPPIHKMAINCDREGVEKSVKAEGMDILQLVRFATRLRKPFFI